MWGKDLLNGWGGRFQILQVVTVRPKGMRGLDYSPVAVLDLRAEAVEGYVEAMARALHGGSWTFDVGDDSSREMYYDNARAAVTALLGPLPKRGKAKGGQ
jgi:hypothetical protein